MFPESRAGCFQNCPKELQCIVNEVIWKKKKKKIKVTNSPSSLEEEKYVYFEVATEIMTLSLQRSALYPCFSPGTTILDHNRSCCAGLAEPFFFLLTGKKEIFPANTGGRKEVTVALYYP